MRAKMYKKGRGKRSTLPEIEEETLADPLLHRIRAETAADVKGSASTMSDVNHDSHLTSNIQKAAALVDQAMLGRWMPLDVVHHKDYLSAKQAFLLYHHLSYPRCAVLVTLIGLSLFEVPEWCQGPADNPCGDADRFLLSGIWYLPPWLTLAVELVCLLLLAWSVALQRYFKFLSFWSNHITIVKVVLLFSLAISMSITVAEVQWMGVLQGRKVSMYLRVLIPILFSRALRGCFRVALRIAEAFLDIGIMVLVYILLSAWLGTLIMKEQFEDYPSTLLKLFSLLTAANDADVWSSAYPHRLAVLFLFIYLIVGLFFLMNVAFAVIYTNFKRQMAVEAKKQVTARQGSLRAAFSLLDTRHQEWIDGPTMIALFLAIGNYRHIPDVRSRTSQLFLALNKRGDFKIWSDDFEDLCDVIAKEVQKRPKAASFSRYRQFEMMWLLGCLQFVKNTAYDYFLWVATMISVAVAISARSVNNPASLNVLVNMEFFFGCLFLLDAVVKILVLGRRLYWKSPLNWFDFIFAAMIVGTHLAAYEYPAAGEWVPILLIVRSFRAVVVFSYFNRWKLQSETLLRMVSACAPILGMQFCVCSIFALLGVHLFEGVVHKDNVHLEGTQYATSGLWVLNYNDYASAMATSLNLCIVGNWYIIMEGYSAATQSDWSRLYFIAFWLITVAFALNVVISFFVEAYSTQMEKSIARAKALTEIARREAFQARNPGLGRSRAQGGPGHFMTFKKTVSYYNLPPRRQ
ncbi:protein MpTPC3 [Marchantia polymorpha subsp. ruderalis]|nr:hypothetical protein MARPO_0062s0036 [Marchantia polymorpha]BBN16272.1 hypothetical protein Mp_7g04900 [Marchantia polymorpha subsp. ruderalis]|eukprot:PTQ36610.1 hypothetical protein MARPO_0062s0036 [Marchantia polymorpha]